jgi:hypothetical protein
MATATVTATTGRAAPPTTNDGTDDVEMGQNNQHKPSIGWNSRSHAHRDSSPAMGSKFGRGGSRGGRKGSYNHNTTRQRGKPQPRPSTRPIIRVRTTGLAGVGAGGHDEQVLLRSSSPRPSEEQTMTYNGIMRVSDVQREIEGMVKDIAVAGKGTFIISGGGANRTPINKTPPPPRTPVPRTPRTPNKPTTPPRPRPSMETIFVGATMVPPPPRPSTSGSGAGTMRRAAPPERYYSESIYPEQGLGKEEEEDDDDRVSRYLDRRFGVVTPKGTTPSSRGWEGSGRPF